MYIYYSCIYHKALSNSLSRCAKHVLLHPVVLFHGVGAADESVRPEEGSTFSLALDFAHYRFESAIILRKVLSVVRTRRSEKQ